MHKRVKRDEYGARVYDDNMPIVAICYDFDRTLSPKEMQEYTVIPEFGMTAEEFWETSGKFAKENYMDKMLAWMHLIIDYAAKRNVKVTEKTLKKFGRKVVLFPGVETWFERINAIGEEIGIHIEHYIISAGSKELIEGTVIAKYFEEVYASSFFYDTWDKPIWVKQVVNASSKTQYLFRVNKGCLDVRNENAVHQYMDDEDRRIPFRNMIYIGDSDTDIPAMKVVTSQGGYSIGVYNPNENGLATVSRLLKQKRITHFAPADYSESSGMHNLIETILRSIKGKEEINEISTKQKTMVGFLTEFSRYFEWLKESIKSGDIDIDEVKKVVAQSCKVMKNILNQKDMPEYDVAAALLYLEQLKGEVEQSYKERKKKLKKSRLIAQESNMETNHKDDGDNEPRNKE